MKKTWFSVLFIAILVFTSCTPQNAQPENTTITPDVQSIPTSLPTATMNSIQQAMATQKAIFDSRPTVTPIAVRTDINMPEGSLRVTSPNGTNEVLFGLID